MKSDERQGQLKGGSNIAERATGQATGTLCKETKHDLKRPYIVRGV